MALSDMPIHQNIYVIFHRDFQELVMKRFIDDMGFTLIEILITLSLLSILAGIFISSYNSNIVVRSQATQIVNVSDAIIQGLQDVYRTAGIPNSIANSEFPLENNTTLDALIFGEEMIKRVFKDAYLQSAVPLMRSQFLVVEEPIAGESPGSYRLEGTDIDIRRSISVSGQEADIFFTRLGRDLIEEIAAIKNVEFDPAGSLSGTFIYGNTSSGGAFAAFPFDPSPANNL